MHKINSQNKWMMKIAENLPMNITISFPHANFLILKFDISDILTVDFLED